MVLTPDTTKYLRQAILDRTLVGTPSQKRIAHDLLVYFNLWQDHGNTEKISEEIEKSIDRWRKKFPPIEKKGVMTDCREVRESLLVKDMLDTLVAEVAKKNV